MPTSLPNTRQGRSGCTRGPGARGHPREAQTEPSLALAVPAAVLCRPGLPRRGSCDAVPCVAARTATAMGEEAMRVHVPRPGALRVSPRPHRTLPGPVDQSSHSTALSLARLPCDMPCTDWELGPFQMQYGFTRGLFCYLTHVCKVFTSLSTEKL